MQMEIQEWLGLLLGHKVTVLAPCTLVQVSQVTCTLSNVGAIASRGAFKVAQPTETQNNKQQWCRFTTCHLRVGISLGLRQIRRKNAMWQMHRLMRLCQLTHYIYAVAFHPSSIQSSDAIRNLDTHTCSSDHGLYSICIFLPNLS